MKKQIIDAPSRSSWSGGWATLRDLEIIQAVIETGGVTAAAESLKITQPAVSRALNLIEKRANRTLFWRENNRLKPTVDALILYREIKNIANSFNKLNHFYTPKQQKTTLRIGVPPTIAHILINKLTAEFILQTEDVYVQLRIMRSDEIITALENNDIDVAIADAAAANINENIHVTPFCKVHYLCAIPRQHPLANNEIIRIDQFNDVKVITLTQHNIGRMTIDRILRKHNCTPTVVAEVPNIETALTFVNAGVGISVAMSLHDYPQLENIVYRPIENSMSSQLAFFTKEYNNLSIQAYIDFIYKNRPENHDLSSQSQ